MMYYRTMFAILMSVLISAACFAAPPAQHVVVIGVDGMTAKSVEAAQTPNMHALMKSGAYTLKASSVRPTVSSPNWESILTGSEPDTHGVHDNDWKPDEAHRFPTIFTALRAANPEANTAVAYEWLGFGRLFSNKEASFRVSALKSALKGDDSEYSAARYVAQRATDLIKENKPQLTFVHLDLVDHAGHSNVYDSPKYNGTVAEADNLVGQIVKAVDDAGIRESTAIFVVSDHGGINTGHGGDTPEEKTVPWIVSGAGVAQGAVLPDGVSVAQTSPTIAALLGVEAPKAWTAKPVAEALKK